MADPVSIRLAGIAQSADEIEEGLGVSFVGKGIDKASMPINTSATTEHKDIGSPASSSAGIAKQAGDQHTGQTFDSSPESAASTFEIVLSRFAAERRPRSPLL